LFILFHELVDYYCILYSTSFVNIALSEVITHFNNKTKNVQKLQRRKLKSFKAQML